MGSQNLLDKLRGPERDEARATLLARSDLDYQTVVTLRRELGRGVSEAPQWPGDGSPVAHACRAWEAAAAGESVEDLVAEAVGLVGFSEREEQVAVMEWCCAALLAARLPHQLLDTAQRGLALSPDHPRLLLFKGAALARKSQPEAAESVLLEALSATQAAEDRRAEMIIRREIGQTHYLRGDTKTAIEHHRQAVALADELEIADEQLILIHGLGSLEYQRRRLDDAQQFYGQALELAHELGDTRRIAQLLGRLGCVARDRGELDEARGLLEQAVAAYGGGPSTGPVHHELGLLEHVAWYPHAALKHYETAIECSQRERSVVHEAVSTVALGMLRLEQRRLPGATEAFERSAFLAGQASHPGLEATASALLAATVALNGDPARAEEMIDEAESRQPVTGSRFDGQLLSAIRGFVAVGHARAAQDHDAQVSWAQQARDMLMLTTTAGADGLRLVDRGADYLLTARVLEGYIDQLGRDDRIGAERIERVRLTPDAGLIETQGQRIDLRRRGPQRRLVAALLAHHQSGAEEPLTVWEVADAAWPDEPDLHPDVASNRVYSAVWTLRKDGLEQIVTTGDGYRFDPAVVFEVTESLDS